jgi:class 3 adenylate cyclase/tetratricopeptide (TPR) repeat protein
MDRRLSAVVAADAIAFSRRLAADDEQTVAAVIEGRRLMQRAAQAQDGRVVSTPGDFILAEFSSATQAIAAALNFVGALAGRPEGAARSLRYRVGVGIGEVMDVDGDLLGNAVNQAARLQQIAKPDQVLVSGQVRDIVERNADAQFRALGTFRLKNLPKPVRVFEASRRAARGPGSGDTVAQPPAPAQIPAASWRPPALVVGPFRALGPDDSAFADSLTGLLIAHLNVLAPALNVFENEPRDGKGLVYRLTGAIEGTGRTRVVAKLVETWTNRVPWSNHYALDRGDDAIEAVVRDMVGAVQIALTEGEQARLWHGSTRSLAAWEQFQRGKDLERKARPETHRRAQRCYRRAMELDPDYLAAIVALAFCHVDEARLAWTSDPAPPLAAAAELAARAARIDPAYPELQSLRGFLVLPSGDFELAIELGRRAAALAPQSSEMAGYLGAIYAASSRWEEAILWYRRAIQLSPHERPWLESNLARMYLFTGRAREARLRYQRALDNDPELLSANVGMAIVLLRLGDGAAARAQAQRILQVDPLFTVDRWAQRYATADARLVEDLKADLRRLGLP